MANDPESFEPDSHVASMTVCDVLAKIADNVARIELLTTQVQSLSQGLASLKTRLDAWEAVSGDTTKQEPPNA